VSPAREVIDRRYFDLMTRRAVEAEEMVKALIDLIAGDDGTWRAGHQDWREAGEALLKGDV
jgi:hypothetical protein